MVKVEVIRSQTGIAEIAMTGHANAGKYGEDIVCSAVSAIILGNLNAVHLLLGLKPDVEMNTEEGGFLKWRLSSLHDPALEEKQQLLAESTVVALLAISQNYGTYISVQDSKWQGGAHS
ncbi:ribosomal-processing cysteine protease Prp [Brevibacillus laterosporus]|uniref:Ribosomal processing cysteine protease Prp n=1 Tax=Brevibacillus laterosporus LMG 15441 TaxID=1042163 RepID=A0A075R7N6_BRELA|nr:ribosomal-processing cysteine protease Prp [Brevibacillus laterosporus]AIG25595.1 putative ribosomal protein [Brevibacillus laterosporus LMG 15441]RJL07087.1 ribosomal-processing cysteine protease Prp [Brevibacillus laterosporus]TPH11340.1 ribosomal-processing cysteine protease Prp [Brevibacillus laterosporus]